MLTLVDHFGGTFTCFVMTTAEVMIIVWWYGLDNFCLDIEFMLKRKVGVYWRITWGVLTPLALLVILLYFIATLETLTYNNVPFPSAALTFGWLVCVVAVSQPLLWWMYFVFKNRKLGLEQSLKKSISKGRWGPKRASVYKEWTAFKKGVYEERMKEFEGFWLQKKINLLLGK